MKRIAITMGDPSGIGGELILKAFSSMARQSIPVVVGDLAVIKTLQKTLFSGKSFVFQNFHEGNPGDVEFVDLGLVRNPRFGVTNPAYGAASYQYIVEALKLAFLGDISAIVTCPISKASIHSAGIDFPGHTEMLAHYSGVKDYVMMMANRTMRVALVTIHIPLREVPMAISIEKILRCVSITHSSLKAYFDIKEPHIKVCGLNPHAGEQGILGSEEEAIREAIAAARSIGMHVDGPFPADTLFHRADCDAFVAMYHDQGLIPVKTVDFERTVNLTLGLPIIRTSPGHGTGFDIAGKGLASPSGLMEAYRVAEQMSAKNLLTKPHP
ncbi:MAG: 4-hydroxythreonine-4-phosphate dehydrogenase 1 [Syntrophorhabdus sp. PtaU1.Bin002]|nr:MAG: 4-hydroxythreonine-4-phosphate dehydrogenase 1 [Syntrophorhabdus sp. PtaU1.Bin002]